MIRGLSVLWRREWPGTWLVLDPWSVDNTSYHMIVAQVLPLAVTVTVHDLGLRPIEDCTRELWIILLVLQWTPRFPLPFKLMCALVPSSQTLAAASGFCDPELAFDQRRVASNLKPP